MDDVGSCFQRRSRLSTELLCDLTPRRTCGIARNVVRNHRAMSTIASPRPSSSIRSPSSTRNSFDSSTRPPPNARRNRAALRDYYGIKNVQKEADAKISEESTRTGLGPEEDETLTELDAADFNAKAFVDSLLAKEGLKGVLKIEADLVSRMLCARIVAYAFC